MKKLLMTAALSLFASTVFAKTTQQFLPLGMQGLTIVRNGDIVSGHTDDDPQALYKFMKVAEQVGPSGNGKSIKVEKEFVMVCGTYQGQTQCQVILFRSAPVTMDPSQALMRYEVTGPQADQLTAQFEMNGDNGMEYMSTDRKFHLRGTPGHFVFESSGLGF